MTALAALLVGALWGTGPILQKWLLQEGVPPVWTAIVSGAAFLFGAFGWYAVQRPVSMPRISLRAWLVLVLGAGLIATIVPNLLYIHLLGRTDTRATILVVFAYMAPVFTVLYNLGFLHEPVRRLEYAGMALVVLGTALMSYASS